MRKQIGHLEAFHETMEKLRGDGLLLVAGVPPNPMTIGWGSLGIIWRRPVFQLLVRPTRYTFGLIENVKDFTVNMLSEEFSSHLTICGTESGREVDKVARCNFTMVHGECSNAYYISQAVLHYECRIIHKCTLDPATLEPEIIDSYYPKHDFHTVYYGEILGVYRK